MTDDDKKRETDKETREDKIFNNSYHHGEKLKGDDYEFSHGLQVDGGYASRFLGDIYKVDDSMTYKLVQQEILKLLDTNEQLMEILKDTKKKKFNKEKINLIFKIIYEHILNNLNKNKFMDIIYIFDHISNISGLKYNNLFDLLEFEYKKLLIIELDKTYNILDEYTNFNKMF